MLQNAVCLLPVKNCQITGNWHRASHVGKVVLVAHHGVSGWDVNFLFYTKITYVQSSVCAMLWWNLCLYVGV